MKIKLKDRENILIYLIIILISVILLGPLINLGTYVLGHDSLFHISNIIAIRETFSSGNWFLPKVYPLIANGFGYGTGIFYGPLTHYFSAFINYLLPNFSVMTIMKLVHLLVILFSMVFMYQFVFKITNKKYVSLLSAVLYVTFPYFLSDIYVRDSFAESASFVFIPLIFNGLYELIYLHNKKSFYKFFVFGVTGLVLTHTITTVFTAFIVFLFLILNIKKIFSNKNYIYLIVSLFFILGMCLFYLVPIIEQYFLADINIFNNGSVSTAQTVSSYALSIGKLLPYSKNTSSDGIQFFILFPMLLLILFSLFQYPKIKNENKKVFLDFAIIGFLLLFMSTNLFPWEIMPSILLYIQFPWRLLLFVDFCFSIFGIVCLLELKQDFLKIVPIFLIVVFVINSTTLLNLDRISNYGESAVDVSLSGIGAVNDYLPTKVVQNYDYFQNRSSDVLILEGEGDIEVLSYSAPFIKFDAQLNSDKLVLELPLLYYYGYKVDNFLNYYGTENGSGNENNQKVIIEESPNGFVQLTIYTSGNYVINYVGSNLSNVSLYISLITFIGFFLFIQKRGSKYEKEK